MIILIKLDYVADEGGVREFDIASFPYSTLNESKYNV